MLVVEGSRKLVIATAMGDEITEVIPHAKQFTMQGEHLTAVRHGVEESLVLKNLGFKRTPAPILSYYHWPSRYVAMEHQKQTSAFMTMNKKALVLNAPGTGKSLSALWAADFLIQEGIAKRVLIIAPLSTVKVVWGKELRHHLPHRSFELLVGSKEQRVRRLQTPGTQFFIVNHDGFAVIQDELAALGIDIVIYDELTAIKTPGSQRFRRMFNWTHQRDIWFWGMTGTPISQSPVDAWTMAKIVDSPNVPKSYTSFRDLVMTKVSTFRWAPRPEALDICQRVLQPSVRYSLEDCTEIPDTLYLGHECPMSNEQVRSFKEMKERAVLLSHDVSAPNMAVALSKMLQICGGYVLGNAGTGVKLDFTGRYDTLKEVVDEIGDKVIVFVPFRGMQRSLLDLFLKDGYDAVIVNGDVTGTKRNKIFDDFQNSDKVKILLAHPKLAAHGLTLTRAKDVIWYLPVYSLEMYEQACARIRRIGTKGKTRVHHLWGTSFERELYSRLQSKRRVLADFLELIQGVNED